MKFLRTHLTPPTCRPNRTYLGVKVAASTLVLSGALVLAASPAAAQTPGGSAATFEARFNQFIASATMSEPGSKTADFIVALVNSEIITNHELKNRVAVALRQMPNGSVPPDQSRAFLKSVLDDMIFERLQLQAAQNAGLVIDARMLANAVQAVAKQNNVTLDEMQERLKKDGISFEDFQSRLRQQLMIQGIRDRMSDSRVRVSDYEVEAEIARLQVRAVEPEPEINLAQILIPVPERVSEEELSRLTNLAKDVAAKAQVAGDFAALAKEVGSKAAAGDDQGMGLKSQDRYPTLFVEAAQTLTPGKVTPPIRSGAGFHIIKMLDKRVAPLADVVVNETHPRHILIRTSSPDAQIEAVKVLTAMAAEIQAGKASFADMARRYSNDGSAEAGGDLGWVGPAQFVPEFEKVMNTLKVGEVSAPTVSRFGVHLIEVIERREAQVSRAQLRERITNQMREARAEENFKNFSKDLRERAYIEFREAPAL